jgi:hypothetical protein
MAIPLCSRDADMLRTDYRSVGSRLNAFVPELLFVSYLPSRRVTESVLASRAELPMVFRRIHKLHKANGPFYSTQGTSRCFCCFRGKLSAGDILFSAEILGRRRFGERKNSGGFRCYLAVLRCFGLEKPKSRDRGAIAGDRFIASSDITARGYCQYGKCD